MTCATLDAKLSSNDGDNPGPARPVPPVPPYSWVITVEPPASVEAVAASS